MSFKIISIIFPLEEKFSVVMPEGAKILSLQKNELTNNPSIWILGDEQNKQTERHFQVFRDNQPIRFEVDVEAKYVGTYQYQRGQVVAHFFEIIK